MDYVLNAEKDTFSETSEPRPWRRYWARMIDFLVYQFAIGFCLYFILFLFSRLHLYKPSFGQVIPFWNLVSKVLWIFPEASLLSLFGTTLGKLLLGIKVKQEDGTKPSYGQALRRSAQVFVYGLGLNVFSLITLITYIASYKRLKSCGSTRWDDSEDLEVTTYPVGNIKMTVAVILIVIALLIQIAAGS